MRVVVTGGTGFIGRNLVDRLLETGDDTLVVTSRRPEARDLWGGRVQIVQAFAGDALSLGKAFRGADVVVHAIQFPNHPVEKPSRGWSYLETDGKGTVVAARTAHKLGVRRFVYLSGAGAGEGRKEPWFRAKDMAEAAIRETGMEHALLRPSWTYGPGDRSMSRFVAFCRSFPAVPVIGNGRTPIYPVYVKDVARCLAEAVRREDVKQTVLELGGPERLTMDEIIRSVQSVLDRRRPLIHQPAALMKLLVLPLQILPEPPLSPTAIDFILQEVELDPRPAMEFFGFRFRSLEEGLRDYLP
jgi:uncharacterized protein YbjT (DUF2867 family)